MPVARAGLEQRNDRSSASGLATLQFLPVARTRPEDKSDWLEFFAGLCWITRTSCLQSARSGSRESCLWCRHLLQTVALSDGVVLPRFGERDFRGVRFSRWVTNARPTGSG